MNRSLSLYADMIFKNGVVVTVDSANSLCEAVAVNGNRIVYVGDNAGAEMWLGPDTSVIDLAGRALLPGFIDSHMHLGMTGQNAAVIIDCNSNKVTSISQIQQKIREAAAKAPKGAWIKATGYEQSKLKEGRHPTRDELDEAAPDNPVQLTRCCLHMGVYNTLALRAGGITGPEMFAPGEVVVDENGRMTGLLKETACTYMWDKVIYTKDEYLRSFKAANDILLSYGVTSMHDGSFYGEETIGLYQDACRNGIIKVRMYNLLYHAYGKKKTIEWVNDFISTGIHGGLGDDHFRLGHVKILIDGSTSAPSCATSQPYSHDPALKGIQLYTQEEADDIIIKAHNAGFNVSAHAVGDVAVDVILTAIERAMAQNPRPCRHRIEHCGIINENLLSRIKKAGIVPVPNPGFFNENAEIYVKYYGDRVNWMFPLRSYLDNGITAALGSDSPVIEADPMIGLYGALTRADKCSGIVAGKDQRIGIMNAIRMYTYNGAYASLEEKIKGSIEPGKLADLVILSGNILDTPVEELKSLKADMTVIDGQIVYER
ncbi:amidohydrolase [Gallibacter sp. Marseille-QA0791]|uniref:amidohydrolase n=1 Tax=Gallibacter sp. Marseille-QA0791 TaxID=3378781 RepID=UPI003D12CAF7